mmetsp:Transcript_42646/g.56307  ORF Transcript_42646/g.56307 Transcript_42646/m.56307 type:complete len:802 (-) Transcript_42646:104-2509(-)
MIEDALREGTAGGGGAEGLGETEGLGDGEEGGHVDERGTLDGVLRLNNTSSLGEALVDATDGVIGALDLDLEDGLDESGGSGQLGGVEDASGGGHDLATTSVDSIGVESNIHDVEADTAHLLVADSTLLGGPLEGGLHGVLDFVEVLHLLGGINEQVGAGGLGTEAPDLLGIVGIPLVVVLELASALLDFLLGADLVILNGGGEVVTERAGNAEDSVMLVGGLGEAGLAGLLNDGLLVLDDGVTLLDGALGVLLLEILEADLDVELTAASDDVLTGLLSGADDERVGLGELAETLDELGEIGGVLDLDGDTHDGGHGVLHGLDAVSALVIGDGALLHEELIDTDETDGVTARNIGDSLDLAAHHEDGSLDVLDVEVVAGVWLVVRAHNADLLASGDGTGEDTAESVEAALVVGGDHLGDEDHEGTVLVAVGDGVVAFVTDGTFVEHSGSVLLGLHGGRKLHDDHLKESLGGVDPLLEDALEEVLGALVLLVVFEVNAEGLEHLPDGVKVVVHDVTAELDDGAHDELDEAALELLAIVGGVVGGELLGGGVEVVVTPEFLHEALTVELELLRVGISEAGQGEGPAEEGGTEGNGTLGGVDLLRLAHILELVGGDDDVGVLDDTLEVLVHGLAIDLKLKDTTVDLVDHHDGLDLLGKSLTEDSLGLHADTLDVIDDDESTVGDTEGGGDLGREVDVTWGVDQVDQVRADGALRHDVGLVVEGHTGGLDGNTTLLLVITSVSEAGIASILASDDTGFCDEGVGQGRLAVVDVGNDRHVTDGIRFVHDLTDLIDSEVGHPSESFL